MAKTRVDIEYVLWLQEERAKINRLDLEDIDFYENGEKIEINEKARKEFIYCGLVNTDFITTEFYKGTGFEEV